MIQSQPISYSIMDNFEFRHLHEFSLILNSTHNIKQILQESAQKLKEMFDSDGCHILFARSIRNDLQLETAIHDGNKPFPPDVDETKGISGNTFKLGKVIIVQEAETDPRITRRMFETFQHHSLISAPINVRNQVIGAIVLYSHLSNHYSERDGEFLRVLAMHLGLAAENAQLLRKIQRAAVLDPLTGAYNRGYFRDELEFLFKQPGSEPLSLIILDVNDLKIINDTYGHTSGDYVLQEITQVFKKNVRENDIVSRYGGDEFTIILPGADTAEALQIVSRIEQAIANNLFTINEQQIPVTISWGYITTKDNQYSSINDIINGADRKLYNMKKQKPKI